MLAAIDSTGRYAVCRPGGNKLCTLTTILWEWVRSEVREQEKTYP